MTKSGMMVRAFFILSIAFIFTPFSVSAATIGSSYTIPASADEDSYFYVTIRMKYSDTVSENTKHFYLDISFPENPSVSIYGYSSSWSKVEDYPKGDDIYHSGGTPNPRPADYLLISAERRGWTANDELYVKLKVKADEFDGSRKLHVYYRMAITYPSNPSTTPFRVPSSGTKDQQGWYVYVKSIDIIAPNRAPSKATVPYPEDAATNQSITVDLDWRNATDPDGDTVSYKVYFGTDSYPDSTEYKTTKTGSSYDPGTLQYSTNYYWKIDTYDGSLTTTGDVWHFRTIPAPPSPQITSIKLNGQSVDSVTITQGYPVDIEISAKNNGGLSSDGIIQASFPSFTGSGDHAYTDKNTSNWSSDLTYREYYHNGPDTIWSHCTNSWVNPQYVLVSAADGSWTNGESNTSTFRVTPQNTGTFYVYIKVAMGNSDFTQYAMDPTYSSYQDQQCEKVYRKTITVQSPPPAINISILNYHKVDDSAPTQYWVTTKNFDEQMAALKAYGYSAVSLEDAYQYMNGNGSLPSKPVIITFDDGYRNFFTKAYPILTEHNFSATNFIITDYIAETDKERRSSGEWEPEGVAEEEYADHLLWSEIQTMSNNGMIFEAHSKTHPDLTALTESEAEDEIADSKSVLESKLGTNVNFFSYPFTLSNSTIEALVTSAGYHGAVTVNGQVFNTATGNTLQIDRIPIDWNDSANYVSSSPGDFFMKKVDPSFQIPQITINSIEYLDPSTKQAVSTAKPGDNILIRVTATNAGPASSVTVSLNIDDDNDHNNGVVYDSHQTTPSGDISRNFSEDQDVFEWTWQVPSNLKFPFQKSTNIQ